jgi:GTP-binding protein
MIVEFVTSAAGRGGFPRDGLPELALIGRSNVGKSSLINALVRTGVARTSAAPGKTRLANVYRVTRRRFKPFYLVDLPGYGYARGGIEARRTFAALANEYFGRETPVGQSALLLVDARHPELASDLVAWEWLTTAADGCAVVATKIDKLARGERIRAMSALTSVYGHSVLPASAVTGEGLDELWTLIDKLLSSPKPSRSSRKPKAPPPPKSPSRRSSSPRSRK